MKMSNDLLCDGDERSVCVQPTECHGPCLRKRKDTVLVLCVCVCVRACACSVCVCVCICVYVSCCLLRHPWVLTCKKCKCAVLGWLCVYICWWLICFQVVWLQSQDCGWNMMCIGICDFLTVMSKIIYHHCASNGSEKSSRSNISLKLSSLFFEASGLVLGT